MGKLGGQIHDYANGLDRELFRPPPEGIRQGRPIHAEEVEGVRHVQPAALILLFSYWNGCAIIKASNGEEDAHGPCHSKMSAA